MGVEFVTDMMKSKCRETQDGQKEIANLAQAIDRLATVIEGAKGIRLGVGLKPRYTRSPTDSELVDEKSMAEALHISTRTLGKYRRAGRLPGCWVRNGKRYYWRRTETLGSWEEGLT